MVGRCINMALSETQKKEQAYIDAARKRGMSQQKIDTFLAENPGDFSRLSTQSVDSGSTKPAPRPPLTTTPSIAAPPPTADSPMAGLTAIAPEASTTPQLSTMDGAGGGMLEPEPPAMTGVATAAL